MLKVFAALVLLTGTAIAAPWEGVFQGTLGKARVLVELNAGSDDSEYTEGYSEGSRYSYAGKIYDLYLTLDKK
jgi:hypothetical protein